MLNTTNNKTIQNTNINVPASGIIQKSNSKSFFVRMQNGIELSKKIFAKDAKYLDTKVCILQVLLMDNEWFIVELVDELHL